jgi:hypothetical protein
VSASYHDTPVKKVHYVDLRTKESPEEVGLASETAFLESPDLAACIIKSQSLKGETMVIAYLAVAALLSAAMYSAMLTTRIYRFYHN